MADAKIVWNEQGLERARELLRKRTAKIADDILRDAKALVPVDTGRLRGSGFVDHDGRDAWQIGFDTDYARHVEFGTRDTPAQSYLVPAAMKRRS